MSYEYVLTPLKYGTFSLKRSAHFWHTPLVWITTVSVAVFCAKALKLKMAITAKIIAFFILMLNFYD